ncbi:hypothetical protein ACKI1I_16085 [Streptomyces turgidiscabies]|uniref:Uncharacterized protein n=1 Tax=Streptomyces turgidiscabies (strain Car8) TaxID=698760 RepID=L7F1C3_STRT8|nr:MULTISPECIES: hypothetical protein [Streptomyces]ELP64949.1 hypothetical protein STRTUCAR8_08334 [Streptomyces turgidiscabies Car8]MDX3495154.1 hypothetical protein [Streptomyces turgidiscabies]GAQ71027.1 hypothetical protein T45_02769 [Streptomyces turgidiscabies]
MNTSDPVAAPRTRSARESRRIRIRAGLGLALLPVSFVLGALIWLYRADQYAHAGADRTTHWPLGLAFFTASGLLGLMALGLPRRWLVWLQLLLLLPAMALLAF